MAKENIAFMVNLRKNTVPDSDMFGRYYPEAESKETLSTKGFAKHVADHGGTLVSYELMQMVLAGIVKCLKEYMSQGQPVKLDGLGTFRPTVTSVVGGAASIEEALQKGVNNMVAGVNFVFIPSAARRSRTPCAPRFRLGASWIQKRMLRVVAPTAVPTVVAHRVAPRLVTIRRVAVLTTPVVIIKVAETVPSRRAKEISL